MISISALQEKNPLLIDFNMPRLSLCTEKRHKMFIHFQCKMRCSEMHFCVQFIKTAQEKPIIALLVSPTTCSQRIRYFCFLSTTGWNKAQRYLKYLASKTFSAT
jgi:hypothetical protein